MPDAWSPRTLDGVPLPPIFRIGESVLRERASEVPPEKIATSEYQALFQTMIAVMRAAPGVGLAAPQIDIPFRVIVLEDREELMSRLAPDERHERERSPFDVRILVNPVLTEIGDERATFFEGCLSVPGYAALVPRSRTVEVTGLDERATAIRWRVSGWPARILQHEVDHLEGTIYVDRMMTRSFAATEIAAARFGGKPSAEIRRLLGLA
jgi:peptide deformylase